MSKVQRSIENPATCPFGHVTTKALARDELLELPMHKRMVVQYAQNEEGVRELRLFHGEKEISFDEPELFAFGETLAQQKCFSAGQAMSWGNGYSWEQVCNLLQTLLDEGVLVRSSIDAQPITQIQRARKSPLEAASAKRARTWFEIEDITRELAGRKVELAYLEAIVPIFRIAHTTVDGDGRQVGEGNVFPRALRIDVPTEWMTCVYSGTRYMADAPMNVSALKSMREHWDQMMAALAAIRAAYVKRFPSAINGLTIGDIERLSTSVLCVPTYMLMRSEGRVQNGELHPVLSGLFRVTDGLRLVMHEMLFVPIGEATRSPEDMVSVEQIHEYAERNYSFHTPTGVCAGPKAMVIEFLRVIVEGELPRRHPLPKFHPQVQEALAHVDQVIDYAMLGLQSYALTYSIWPAMTRTYAQIAQIVSRTVAAGVTSLESANRRLQALQSQLEGSPFLAHENWRSARDTVYADMYAKCGSTLAHYRQSKSLEDCLRPLQNETRLQAESAIRAALVQLIDQAQPSDIHIEALTQSLAAFVSRLHALIAETQATQSLICQLLGRPGPQARLNAQDIEVHNRLQGDDQQRLPFLLDELPALFGLGIDICSRKIEIRGQAAFETC